MTKKIVLAIAAFFIVSTIAVAQTPTPTPVEVLITHVYRYQESTSDIQAGIDYQTNMILGKGYGRIEFVVVYFQTSQNGTLTINKVLDDGVTEVQLYTVTQVSSAIIWAPDGNYILKNEEQLRCTVTGSVANTGILQFFISGFK